MTPRGRERGRALTRVALVFVGAVMLGAANRAGPVQDERSIAGVVMRGTPTGPEPIANVRVVLHRVAPGAAGPLDSMLTDRRGRYAFRYRATGSSEAVYFVSASYGGVAYFTTPLRSAVVRSDDALIMVFDTTSGPVHVHVIGHHIVLGQPDPRGKREIVEVFELGNDSAVTRVASEGKPLWTAPLPEGAENARVNPSGEVAPSAVAFRDRRVQLFAPLSPGARQLSYAYELPSRALPLTIRIEEPSDVLEVLLEEPRSRIAGPRLEEVQPVTTAGRTFRRFVGQAVPANSVIRIDVPTTLADVRNRWLFVLALTCGLAMIAALLVAFRRRRGRVAEVVLAAPAPARESEVLLREIAALDSSFSHLPAPSDEDRKRYETTRGSLKARLAAMLAEERTAP